MIRQSRRHDWQPKFEMEFGLLAIERDPVSNDVLLAMCGFCKAFGREGKYDQMVQQDQEFANDTKKRRRRSLTTTKFFRAFRIDNIRSHLQGAHPRRWTEYDLLPKLDSVRTRYLQGEVEAFDHLPLVDDVVLAGSALNTESDATYVRLRQPAQASPKSEAQNVVSQSAHNGYISAGYSANYKSNLQVTASLTYSGSAKGAAVSVNKRKSKFDHERHMAERIALDRERLEFDKMRFNKEVELRERELALREKQMDQQIALQEKNCEANRESAQILSAKFYRLAEVLKDVITGTRNCSEEASMV
ncbi:uncharacterized protein PHALS_06683 [Plasmopara halstedii]|uniref:Uncharacterized protein n=1 Tax=Plasmopara halstedii TaxID=4781 RepID=A0A0P1B5V2_PLAHL|nr:uncharacterized protein PHALS_06683 [Plasmopara halstedii]CEG48888.1 hypothetical protein PHALS_06683 [Plasmopara halstedii]|eukprot:XP_024585257.1 hypothetical protein PHALS_06683 [Plasmopara halstedii]